MNNPAEENKKTIERAKHIGKKFLRGAGGTVLFLIALELGLHVVYALFSQQTQKDQRFSMSPYKDKPWADELYKNEVEFGNMPTQWSRYAEWTRGALNTTYINIDNNGRRNTWNPKVAAQNKLKQVWFLGGSSTFSSGARDDYTIPSDFSKIVNANGARYHVSNYGMYAYVFPQSVMEFVKLLEAGERPDYVVFYGGAADIDAAYDAGYAGAISAEAIWSSQITQNVPAKAVTTGKEILRDYCLTCRLALKLVRSIDSGAARVSTIKGMTLDKAGIDALAQDVANNYIGTISFIDHLAATYHFGYMAVWEPSLFGDRLVGDEKNLLTQDWRLSDKNNSYLYTATTALLGNKSLLHFLDLSNALKSRTAMIFLDDVHITEDGNQIIAQKIADAFARQAAR